MSSETDHEKRIFDGGSYSRSKTGHRPIIQGEARSPGTHAEHQHAVTKGEVDDTTVFYNLNKDTAGPLAPGSEKRLVQKNFWFLLGQTWWIAFLIHLDKSTLSQASTMGIFKDVEMTKKQYNDLFVVLYTGYSLLSGPVPACPSAPVKSNSSSALCYSGLSCSACTHLRRQEGSLWLSDLSLAWFQTESQIVPSTTILHQAFFPPKKSPWVQLLWWASGSLANVLLTMVAYKLILLDDSQALVGGLLSSWGC
ncbi:hypothetical protein BDP81DRAFT_50100 [Colletotrichum phormii]|uniref:Uncharacterized protein n=1 Tax=Colletotrichum phormii TaxID=359342 RepID=A0AAI9ZMC8_9PEZI|nr:uncharacterized protein BDP81DRAFT_50100 [Colletotrichum phormii]KAK1634594.1 hypothetical protein BDP81DRAFT_50100 [Colletotrichum phormii]